MEITNLISLLRICGFAAIFPAVLSLVGVVLLGLRYPPGQMRKISRKNALTAPPPAIEAEPKEMPKPKTVTIHIPQDAADQISQLWARSPKPPGGWTSSMEGGDTK